MSSATRACVRRCAANSSSAAAVVMKGCKSGAWDLYNRWRRIMRRSARIAEVMKELVKLFTQIALLRRGPQDLPASMLLLALTIVAYLVVNLAAEWPAAAARGRRCRHARGRGRAAELVGAAAARHRASRSCGTWSCCASPAAPSAPCRPPPPYSVSRSCWRRCCSSRAGCGRASRTTRPGSCRWRCSASCCWSGWSRRTATS